MSPHRHNNSYCRPVKPVLQNVLNSTTIEEFKKSVSSRYHNLNQKAYVKYGTIEFRGAQGTVEIDRILAWIELTHQMVATAETMTTDKPMVGTTKEEQLQEMFSEFNMNAKSQKHYKSVQKFFAKLA
jgi:hypothetical protein